MRAAFIACAALGLVPLLVPGADKYVDSQVSSSGIGLDWTTAKKTIREALDLAVEGDTIWVRGGADRLYTVATGADLMAVPADNVALRSSGGDAKVEIAENLYVSTNDASVITIPSNSLHFTISGFDFTYYGSRGVADAGSLANRGRVIDIFGDYVTVEDCTFRQVGNYSTSKKSYTYSLTGGDTPDKMGHAAVATRAYQRETYKGRYLSVRRCRFLGESEDRSMSAIIHGRDSVLSENVFSNCYFVVWPVKNCDTPFLFASNILYRCRYIMAKYHAWQEWPNAEFAYNIFFSDTGEDSFPVFYKNDKHGLVGPKVLIHHNTIVGAENLAQIANNLVTIKDNGTVTNISYISWQPQFFDNLILLDRTADNPTIFKNNQSPQYDFGAFEAGNYSSFKTGGAGSFKNNAWYAPGGISGGPAKDAPGYDLSKGCAITNNIVLDDWPKFMSMDLGSPDFLRPKESRNKSWAVRGVAWTDDKTYPDYIGAVEPFWESSGISISLR